MKLSRLVVCFVISALVGCAQQVVPQDQASHAPNAPENSGNMPEHGGGSGGGDSM
jgi:hypothetical protein